MFLRVLPEANVRGGNHGQSKLEAVAGPVRFVGPVSLLVQRLPVGLRRRTRNRVEHVAAQPRHGRHGASAGVRRERIFRRGRCRQPMNRAAATDRHELLDSVPPQFKVVRPLVGSGQAFQSRLKSLGFHRSSRQDSGLDMQHEKASLVTDMVCEFRHTLKGFFSAPEEKQQLHFQ